MASYANISGLNGTRNAAGYTVEVYAAPISEFTTIATFKTSTDPGDSVTIAGDHTFAGTKGFVKWYSTVGTAQLMSEVAGDTDGHILQMKAEIYIPGHGTAAAEQMVNALHDDWIFIFTDVNDPTVMMQVGTQALPAKIKPAFEGGKLGDGRKGWKCQIEQWADRIAFYQGVITMKTA